MTDRKRWRDLTRQQRSIISVSGLLQVTLLAAALRDLRRRPPELVNGSKKLWTGVVFVNYIGPLLYFWKGRRAEAA
ncbi:MAG TPA: hypothetical protein VK875_12965 [Euzebyales bacterium]|nr:hypothetical protein [Euzebyales bacterium]